MGDYSSLPVQAGKVRKNQGSSFDNSGENPVNSFKFRKNFA
jgi:hypothetical protein